MNNKDEHHSHLQPTPATTAVALTAATMPAAATAAAAVMKSALKYFL